VFPKKVNFFFWLLFCCEWLRSHKKPQLCVAEQVTCYFRYGLWGFHNKSKGCRQIRSLNGTKSFPLGEHRVGFININDMYNNDVGKGVVYAYEAYEAK